MAKHSIIKTGLLICYLLLQPFAMASNKMIEFFAIEPAACVVERTHSCEGNFRFRWQLNTQAKICIFQRDVEQALYCAESQREGSVILMVNAPGNNEFVLEAANQQVKANITLQELGVDVRRTRRHLWDVF